MNDDLCNEIEAINSIYGEGTLAADDLDIDVFVLRLPQQNTSIRLQFADDYPTTAPNVLGIHSVGDDMRKGQAGQLLEIFRCALDRLFQFGEVCLFDVIEEVSSNTIADNPLSEPDQEPSTPAHDTVMNPHSTIPVTTQLADSPSWTLSDVVVELKSVFIARCTAVSSTEQAKLYLQHLLASEKKVRSATHNITAWRIRGGNNTTFQDCDDDGETAAGGRLLHLMQLMDVWDVMVIVTRWYGGHQLGPKRFSIINSVARGALVKGAFVHEEAPKKNKSKN